MNAINSKLELLRRRASNGQIEVEHLIEFAVIGDRSATPVIRELQLLHNWRRTNHIGNAHVVPLARWAEVVCVYLDGGCEALVRYAQLPETGACYFAISVLRQIKSPEAIRGLIDFVSSISTTRLLTLDDKFSIADAINMTFSFKTSLPIAPNDAASLRSFLHELLAVCDTDSQRVRCLRLERCRRRKLDSTDNRLADAWKTLGRHTGLGE